MNDELLRAIYDNEGFATKASFEEFKTDFSKSPELRRELYNRKFSSKATFDEFERDLGILKDIPEEKEESDFYKSVVKVPVIGKMVGHAIKAFESGVSKGKTVDEGISALTGDLTEEEGQSVVDILKRNKRQVEGDNSITKKFTDSDKWDPGTVAGAFAESVVESAAMMGRAVWDAFTNWKTASIVGGAAAAGAGAAGASSFGIGAPLGGAAGALGSVSALLEASQLYYDEVNKELNKRGLDITKENLRLLHEDETWLDKTRKKAIAKGGIVGGFDLLSTVVGGKIGMAAGKAGFSMLSKQGLKTGAKALAIDSGTGVAGEYLGSKSIGEEASTKELILEANPFGFGTLTAPFTMYNEYKKIKAAKDHVIDSKIENTPITKEEDELSKQPIGPSAMLDAHKNLTDPNVPEEEKPIHFDMMRASLVDQVASGQTKEDFAFWINQQAQLDGTSEEEVTDQINRFNAVHDLAQTINIELQPREKSAVLSRIVERNDVKAELEGLTERQNIADEALKISFDERIENSKKRVEELNEDIRKIVIAKDPKIVESMEELDKEMTGIENDFVAEKTNLTDKSNELHSIIRDINSNIRKFSASDERLQNSTSQFVLNFDENPVSDGNDSAKVRSDIKQFSNIIDKTPPRFVIEAIGDGDYEKGKSIFEKAKRLTVDVRNLQGALNPTNLQRRNKLIEAGRTKLADFRSKFQKAPETIEVKKETNIPVSDEEYNNFIDKGVVSDERITNLAEKVKLKLDLNDREKAIFANKTSEINEKISEESIAPNKKLLELTKPTIPDLQFTSKQDVLFGLSGKKLSATERGRIVTELQTKEKTLKNKFDQIKRIADCKWS